ncbi:SAM-dependent methyltransferase [Aquincola sp. MAHUQ-54]|uniref:SAM-dependent methyltransferase n=1 Tax=Aquincola agrisoli TaxID=3119538 RepID=A0AAW9QEI2_9BURK
MYPNSEVSPVDRFFDLLQASLAAGTLAKLVLGKYHGEEPDLQRLTVRPLALRGEPHLSFVSTYRTRDVTKNHPLDDGLALLRGLAGPAFGHVHLLTTDEDVQLLFSRKGKPGLVRRPAQHARAAGAAAHDREKHRFLALDRPFLRALGVTDAQGQLVPAMSRKWKQINKFVEVLDHAFDDSTLARREGPVRVLDFGAGKGYLTFAVHDYLSHTRGRAADVHGIELRQDMVQLCEGAARRLGLAGLHFHQGDVGSVQPAPVDVMIALHACDTATDHALHHGVVAGASVILSAPCCHKQIRPQMKSPSLLQPMLQHGIHLGQQAEMVTDSLRALLLEAHGYATQVFEFVSLEHTSKNKMILAVKRPGVSPSRAEALRAQIREIKAFYGIAEHCLETLLDAPAPQASPSAAVPA